VHADVLYHLVSSARPESSKHPPNLNPAAAPCRPPMPPATAWSKNRYSCDFFALRRPAPAPSATISAAQPPVEDGGAARCAEGGRRTSPTGKGCSTGTHGELRRHTEGTGA
jgi:hypothetical protein